MKIYFQWSFVYYDPFKKDCLQLEHHIELLVQKNQYQG